MGFVERDRDAPAAVPAQDEGAGAGAQHGSAPEVRERDLPGLGAIVPLEVGQARPDILGLHGSRLTEACVAALERRQGDHQEDRREHGGGGGGGEASSRSARHVRPPGRDRPLQPAIQSEGRPAQQGGEDHAGREDEGDVVALAEGRSAGEISARQAVGVVGGESGHRRYPTRGQERSDRRAGDPDGEEDGKGSGSREHRPAGIGQEKRGGKQRGHRRADDLDRGMPAGIGGQSKGEDPSEDGDETKRVCVGDRILKAERPLVDADGEDVGAQSHHQGGRAQHEAGGDDRPEQVHDPAASPGEKGKEDQGVRIEDHALEFDDRPAGRMRPEAGEQRPAGKAPPGGARDQQSAREAFDRGDGQGGDGDDGVGDRGYALGPSEEAAGAEAEGDHGRRQNGWWRGGRRRRAKPTRGAAPAPVMAAAQRSRPRLGRLGCGDIRVRHDSRSDPPTLARILPGTAPGRGRRRARPGPARRARAIPPATTAARRRTVGL